MPICAVPMAISHLVLCFSHSGFLVLSQIGPWQMLFLWPGMFSPQDCQPGLYARVIQPWPWPQRPEAFNPLLRLTWPAMVIRSILQLMETLCVRETERSKVKSHYSSLCPQHLAAWVMYCQCLCMGLYDWEMVVVLKFSKFDCIKVKAFWSLVGILIKVAGR